MNKTFALSIILLVAVVAILSSCKRKELVETRRTRVQRQWRLVKSATDANGNNILDATEKQPVDASIINTIVFNPDGSGNEKIIANGVTTDYPFIWSMDAKMDTITRNGVGHNLIKYYLEDISSINMDLITTSNLGLAGYYYKPS